MKLQRPRVVTLSKTGRKLSPGQGFITSACTSRNKQQNDIESNRIFMTLLNNYAIFAYQICVEKLQHRVNPSHKDAILLQNRAQSRQYCNKNHMYKVTMSYSKRSLSTERAMRRWSVRSSSAVSSKWTICLTRYAASTSWQKNSQSLNTALLNTLVIIFRVIPFFLWKHEKQGKLTW